MSLCIHLPSLCLFLFFLSLSLFPPSICCSFSRSCAKRTLITGSRLVCGFYSPYQQHWWHFRSSLPPSLSFHSFPSLSPFLPSFPLPTSLPLPSLPLPVFSPANCSPSVALSTQVVLLVTSLMLRRLVIEAHRRNRVSFIHVRPANTALDNQPYHRGSWHLAVLREQQSEEFSSPYTLPLPPPSCPCSCHKRVRTQKQVSLDTAHHRPPLCNCNCHKYESE